MVYPAPSSRIVRFLLGTKYVRHYARKFVKLYRTQTNDGIIIYVRAGDDSDGLAMKEIFEGHIYEKYFAPAEGSIVVDVGADSGCFTLRASRLVGKSGRIIAFEPFSESFSLLEKHLKINHCANVTAYCLALGSQSGTAHLNVYREAGNNSLFDKVGFYGKRGWLSQTGSEEVTVDTLDSVISKLHLGQIDILKIDTEGSELEVLKGASKVLRSFHPKVVAEIHPYGASWRDIEVFLTPFGYNTKFEDYPEADKLLYAW